MPSPVPDRRVQDAVLVLALGGDSVREIAGKLRVSKTTAAKYAKQALPASFPRKGAGRKSAITARQERLLARNLVQGAHTTASALSRASKEIIGVKVSRDRVRKALHSQGFKVAKKVKKPNLLGRHKRARLAFALKYRHWTLKDWKRVIWSDETKVNHIGSDSLKWYWKSSNAEVLQDDGIEVTEKYGGGGIMAWSCISWGGVGSFQVIRGRMKAQDYVQILEDSLKPSMCKWHYDPCMPKRKDMVFQQDNDPKHTSKLAKTYLKTQGIPLLDWPAKSPDLNPIEAVWGTLKRKIHAQGVCKSITELEQRASACWAEIALEDVRKVLVSMSRRLEAVIKARGGHTKY